MTASLLSHILSQLEHDQYRISDGGDEQDRRDRARFNAGVQHAMAVIRTFAALEELRDAEVTTPRERFDVGGDS